MRKIMSCPTMSVATSQQRSREYLPPCIQLEKMEAYCAPLEYQPKNMFATLNHCLVLLLDFITRFTSYFHVSFDI